LIERLTPDDIRGRHEEPEPLETKAVSKYGPYYIRPRLMERLFILIPRTFFLRSIRKRKSGLGTKFAQKSCLLFKQLASIRLNDYS
jgi:hypothetical protein